jgi:hypothetical protein
MRSPPSVGNVESRKEIVPVQKTSLLTFVDETSKLHKADGGCHGKELVYQVLPKNSMWYMVDKPASDGSGLFQKWCRSSGSYIPAQPFPAKGERLSLQFIDCISDRLGHQFASMMPWIRDLPPRLGSSLALDSAVGCLMSTCSSLAHRQSADNMIDAHLYGQCLRSLQHAISDPAERFSSQTLTATAVIYLVEVYHICPRSSRECTFSH